MGNWTVWKGISDLPKYDKCAVYEIKLVGENKKTIQIPRFLNVDKLGILCIGHTIHIRSRIKQFERGARIGNGHSEGNLVYVLKEDSKTFKRKYQNISYKYRYKPVKSQTIAKKEESFRIKGYFKKFGEVPTLNSAIPDSKDKRFKNGWIKGRFP